MAWAQKIVLRTFFLLHFCKCRLHLTAVGSRLTALTPAEGPGRFPGPKLISELSPPLPLVPEPQRDLVGAAIVTVEPPSHSSSWKLAQDRRQMLDEATAQPSNRMQTTNL